MEQFAELHVNLNIEGRILDLDRFTSHDGPGIRTTVFLMGCPLKCRWCHSPESQSTKPQLFYQSTRCQACFQCVPACPVNAIKTNIQEAKIDIDRIKCTSCGSCGRACLSKAISLGGSTATVGEVLSIVVKDKAYFKNSGGGVTLSGGELLTQPDFSFNLLKACQALGIHTAVETSGFGSKKDIERITSATDLLLFDLKALNSDEHKAFTGVSNKAILRNLECLCEEPAVRQKIVIRIPCIPSINDSEHQIMSIARYSVKLGVKKIELMRYNEVAGAKYEWIGEKYELEGVKTQDDQTLEKLKAICIAEGLDLVSYK